MVGQRSSTGYAFVAFPLAVLFLFTLLPTVAGLGLAFFQWDGSGPPAFVGLRNFRALLADNRFGPALRHTLVFVLTSVPPSVLLAFLLAVAVHAKWFRAKAAVRTLLFMPTIVSVVAIGFVWRWVLDDQTGLLNFALDSLGVDDLLGIRRFPNWLHDDPWPLVWVVVVSVWRQVGFCLVLYMAALSNVNESLYEAAEVDGASRSEVLRHITWPQVAPMTVFLLVTGVISALQVFDIVYVMGGAFVNVQTTVLNYEIYNQFRLGNLGYAAAIGVVIFAITALATALQLRVAGRERAPRRVPAGGARRLAAAQGGRAE